MDDTLVLEVKISFPEDGAAQQDTMALDSVPGGAAASLQRRQALVLLNVGGESFKIAYSTLAQYPDSLLFKMVQEFPELVGNGEEVYVDRSPKAFPWIQEIYR